MTQDPLKASRDLHEAVAEATRPYKELAEQMEEQTRPIREALRPWAPDPSKARAARTLAKQRRWAEELRAAGWTVVEPAA